MGKLAIILFLFISIFSLLAQDQKAPEGMVLVPGAAFQMGIEEHEIAELAEMGKKVPHMDMVQSRWWFGDEIPLHEVTLNSFFIDIYEVTNAQYSKFVEESKYTALGEWEKYNTEGRENHPVVNVTWTDAAAYAEWAGKRLPAEAEWEYAARGSLERRWFTWGNEPNPEMANYRSQGETFFAGLWRLMGFRKIGTKPVGSYPANGYGLYDMIGNVSEWMADPHLPYPGATELEDPYRQFGPWGDDPPDYNNKVFRGGGWDDPNAVFIRITGRSGLPAGSSSRSRGFRCVKSIDE